MIAGALAAAGAAALVWTLRSRAPAERQLAVLDRYCVGCHNDDDLAGGISFKKLDRTDLGRNAAVWEAAVRKLRAGLMPPKGEPRPERNVLDATAALLEHELDT